MPDTRACTVPECAHADKIGDDAIECHATADDGPLECRLRRANQRVFAAHDRVTAAERRLRFASAERFDVAKIDLAEAQAELAAAAKVADELIDERDRRNARIISETAAAGLDPVDPDGSPGGFEYRRDERAFGDSL